MARFTLDVLVETDPSGGWLVRSPAVGAWSRFPVVGQALDGDGAGVLTQGGLGLSLRLPDEVSGRVRQVFVGKRRSLDVEWGQELFVLAPSSTEVAMEPATETLSGGDSPVGDVLVSPTDGVFYTRPSPDAAAFVAPGDTLTRGQAIGLIEVMKTFNHVLFTGAGLPETAIVEAFLVDDGEELTAGKPILRFRTDD
jgi:acetyl-CoA carboxylase biotin carboxyl carrier protein